MSASAGACSAPSGRGGLRHNAYLERCEHWKRELQLGGEHFLILMFSKQACNDFKSKAKQLQLKGYTDKNVRTIHSFAGSILHKVDAMSALQTCVTNAADVLTAAGAGDDMTNNLFYG